MSQPTKLAMHFIFALVLVVYTFWLGLQLSVPERAGEACGAGASALDDRDPGGTCSFNWCMGR